MFPSGYVYTPLLGRSSGLTSRFVGHQLAILATESLFSNGMGVDELVPKKFPWPEVYGFQSAACTLPAVPTQDGLVRLGGMESSDEFEIGRMTIAMGRL